MHHKIIWKSKESFVEWLNENGILDEQKIEKKGRFRKDMILELATEESDEEIESIFEANNTALLKIIKTAQLQPENDIQNIIEEAIDRLLSLEIPPFKKGENGEILYS